MKESQKEILIPAGFLAIGSKTGLLRSTPLGSCVAFIAYDKFVKIGGMVHIMLPGISSNRDKVEENKYAENAITNLLLEITKQGAKRKNIEICLIGGANVLRKDNDTIANSLISSVLEIVESRKLNVLASSLGGYERRSALLNLNTGAVYYTIGDSKQKQLGQFSDSLLEDNK